MLPVIAQEMITFPDFAVAIVVDPDDTLRQTINPQRAGRSKPRSNRAASAQQSIGSPRVSDLGNDPVLDRAYLVDLAPDGISDDQSFRRLECEANTARSSRENDI